MVYDGSVRRKIVDHGSQTIALLCRNKVENIGSDDVFRWFPEGRGIGLVAKLRLPSGGNGGSDRGDPRRSIHICLREAQQRIVLSIRRARKAILRKSSRRLQWPTAR